MRCPRSASPQPHSPTHGFLPLRFYRDYLAKVAEAVEEGIPVQGHSKLQSPDHTPKTSEKLTQVLYGSFPKQGDLNIDPDLDPNIKLLPSGTPQKRDTPMLGNPQMIHLYPSNVEPQKPTPEPGIFSPSNPKGPCRYIAYT